MSTSITQNLTSMDIFKTLAPLTHEPFNDAPATRLLKNTNHLGWVRSFIQLIQTEKSIDFTQLDQETIYKVQQAFDRVLDSMVNFGFDVNKNQAWENCKPIHKAAGEGCLMILNALIKKGADTNGYDYSNTCGYTPLYSAAFANQIKAAELLVQNGADVNKPSTGARKVLPLHIATSPEMCALLVRHGCPVNARSEDTFHESALHWNAHCARPDTVLALLKLGANDFNHPTAGNALGVAKKVHDKTYSVMMGNPWNPVATRLTVDLLANPDLAKTIFPSQKL